MALTHKSEHQEIQHVFGKLIEADHDLFERFTSVSDYIAQRASATLDDAHKCDWESARKRLADARREVQDLRVAIGTAMIQLHSLKNEFIIMSGSTVA